MRVCVHALVRGWFIIRDVSSKGTDSRIKLFTISNQHDVHVSASVTTTMTNAGALHVCLQ